MYLLGLFICKPVILKKYVNSYGGGPFKWGENKQGRSFLHNTNVRAMEMLSRVFIKTNIKQILQFLYLDTICVSIAYTCVFWGESMVLYKQT